MLTEIPTTEFRATLDRCAEDLLWEASIDRPAVDAYRLAERLGIVVTHDAAMPGRARYARLVASSCRSVETIVLGDEPRPERRHFAAAHEVGEARADRVFDTLGVDPREAAPDVRERVANSLAGRLLAPTRWLRGLWLEHDGDLLVLKALLATASHELIARRALECVAAPMIVTVTDHNRVVWRRWNLSGAAPPRLRLEIDCQRHAHEYAAPAWGDGRDEPRSTCGPPLERVRSWPIHEPGWRREITVTELYGDEPEWF